MATVKSRLTRLEELVALSGLRASDCPFCGGTGHAKRFVIPWIGDQGGRLWGEQERVSDDRIDDDGRCMACGAVSALVSVIELELPPRLARLRTRLLD